MATISVRVDNGKRVVTVRGRLAAGDLRRLEHACGPALEHRELPLELRLVHGRGIDGPVQVFLAGLVKRGAVLS